MMYKRYLVFTWLDKAQGGFNDIKESFDDMDSVNIYISTLRKYHQDGFHYQIIDKRTLDDVTIFVN